VPPLLTNLDKSGNSKTLRGKLVRKQKVKKINGIYRVWENLYKFFSAVVNEINLHIWGGITLYKCSSCKEHSFVSCILMQIRCLQKSGNLFFLGIGSHEVWRAEGVNSRVSVDSSIFQLVLFVIVLPALSDEPMGRQLASFMTMLLGLMALHTFYEENLIFLVMLVLLTYPLLLLTHNMCRGWSGVAVSFITLVYLLTWYLFFKEVDRFEKSLMFCSFFLPNDVQMFNETLYVLELPISC